MLCSTGALGYRPDLLRESWLADTAPELHADGFELMIYRDWSEETGLDSALLASRQVHIPVVHLSKRLGEHFSQGDAASIATGLEMLRRNCALASLAGAQKGVLHLWGLPCSDDNFDSTLTALPDALTIAAEYGIELLAETIPCRTQPLLHRMEQVVEACPSIRFTADTRMLCHQELLERIFSEKWLWCEERIAHLHISDCTFGTEGNIQIAPILHPGEGIIDFLAFFQHLKACGYQGDVTLESPGTNKVTGILSLSRLNQSLDSIHDWLK